jgi:hypothetical protein
MSKKVEGREKEKKKKKQQGKEKEKGMKINGRRSKARLSAGMDI